MRAQKGNGLVTVMEKIARISRLPMGMASDLAPIRKEWIAAALGAGMGLASSLIGGIQASKAARRAERRQREQEAAEEAWYNRRYNEDYLDTAAGQNLVRRAKAMYDDNIKKVAGAQAVAGGTDAATAAAKERANQAMGDTIANIAASDQSRKASVDAAHQSAQSEFAKMDMQRELTRAQNITNAAQAASNAMISAGAALEQGNTTRASLTGGSNNSTASAGGSSAGAGSDAELSFDVDKYEDNYRKLNEAGWL